MIDPDSVSHIVYIHYRNYKGEIGWREIEPVAIFFGANEWHPDPQWLLNAIDHTKRAARTFALKDVLEWRTTPPEVKGSSRQAKMQVIDLDGPDVEVIK